MDTAERPHTVRADRFTLPAAALDELLARICQVHAVIGRQNGCLGNTILKRPLDLDRVEVLTIVSWRSAEDYDRARRAVQTFQRETGFDTAGFLAANGVTVDRVAYEVVG